jgi:hypothetical protein
MKRESKLSNRRRYICGRQRMPLLESLSGRRQGTDVPHSYLLLLETHLQAHVPLFLLSTRAKYDIQVTALFLRNNESVLNSTLLFFLSWIEEKLFDCSKFTCKGGTYL